MSTSKPTTPRPSAPEDLPPVQVHQPVNSPVDHGPAARQHYNQGVTLVIQGQYALAIDELTRSIDLVPSSPGYHFRAWAKANLGQYPEAINDATEALKYPTVEPALLYYNRALWRSYIRDYTGADADLVESLRHTWNDPAVALRVRIAPFLQQPR